MRYQQIKINLKSKLAWLDFCSHSLALFLCFVFFFVFVFLVDISIIVFFFVLQVTFMNLIRLQFPCWSIDISIFLFSLIKIQHTKQEGWLQKRKTKKKKRKRKRNTCLRKDEWMMDIRKEKKNTCFGLCKMEKKKKKANGRGGKKINFLKCKFILCLLNSPRKQYKSINFLLKNIPLAGFRIKALTHTRTLESAKERQRKSHFHWMKRGWKYLLKNKQSKRHYINH